MLQYGGTLTRGYTYCLLYGGALASTRPVVFPWTAGELWGNWDSAQQRQWCDGNKGDDFSVGEQPEYERHCLFVPP
jgi:hypothetical protein